ncbi:MAG: UbiX family flavin prenyltransferase [Alphaproteobacteria bacterium]
MTDKPHIIVGISGASGAIYGIRMLEALKAAGVTTHLMISKAAQITIAHETDYSVDDVKKLASHYYNVSDLAACISSGSFKTSGMVIAPCSMRTLAEIATANTSSLMSRSADVILKERRKLVLMVRETPLNNAHLRNMLYVSEMGGIIAPPVPAMYSKPVSIEDMISHTIGRILDVFEVDHTLVSRWQGLKKEK